MIGVASVVANNSYFVGKATIRHSLALPLHVVVAKFAPSLCQDSYLCTSSDKKILVHNLHHTQLNILW